MGYAFRVEGIEPRGDPAWVAAGEATHREYWRQVVKFVLIEKDRDLAAGKDRFGEDMTEIAPSTRAKGRWRSHTGMGSASAPPLDPAYRMSRTRSLFTGRAKADHAEFYWKFDEVTGRHWGKVLGYHRAGIPRAGGLVVRDVIGLSPQATARVKARADGWWSAWKAGERAKGLAREFRIAAPAVAPPRPAVPAPPRPAVAVAALGPDPYRYATFGIGGSEALIRRAHAEGKLRGAKRLGEPPAKPPPAAPKPPPPAPKPITPVAAPVKPPPPPKPKPKPKPKPVQAAPPVEAIPVQPAKPPAKPAPIPVQAAPPVKPVPVPKPEPKPTPAPVVPTPKPTPVAPAPAPAPPVAGWTPRKQSEFHAFTSGKSMEQFGQESFGAWADALPQAEKNAVKLYAASNYTWMNAILRGEDPAKMQLPAGLSPQGARDYIARTVAPLARGKVDRDVVAYRGIRDAEAMGIDLARLGDLKPGHEMTVEGFGSSSLARDRALHFATSKGDMPNRAVLQFNLPKGSTGGYLNAAELTNYPLERELLIPPGAKFRFVGQGGTATDPMGNTAPVLIFERVD